jgi:hypothetical protein
VKPSICNESTVTAIINNAPVGAKILLDARKCDVLQLSGNDKEAGSSKKIDWDLKGDLAVFAPGFESDKWFRIASDRASVNLWLVTPEDTGASPDKPDCQGKNSKLMKTIIDEPISGIIYTPCELELANKAFWRGQIYAGKVTIADMNTELQYAPVRVPWGAVSAADEAGQIVLGERESIRDVD